MRKSEGAGKASGGEGLVGWLIGEAGKGAGLGIALGLWGGILAFRSDRRRERARLGG